MKKRIFTVLLAIMMITIMTACNAPTKNIADPTETKQQETVATDMELTFAAMTVIDNEYCTITIDDVQQNDLHDYTLSATIINKTNNISLMVTSDFMSANGIKLNPMFAETIDQNTTKTVNIAINDIDNTLANTTIDKFTDIGLTLRVYDTDKDDGYENYIACESVNIYPYGEKYATPYKYEICDTDVTIFDNNYGKIITRGYKLDADGNCYIDIFVTNKTNNTLTINIGNPNDINSSYWCTTLNGNTSEFAYIFMQADEFKIDDSGNIEPIDIYITAYSGETDTGYYLIDWQTTLTP